MSEIATPPMPRVQAAVAAARSVIAEVSDAPVWSMDATQVTEALDDLAALESQTAALRSRLVRQAETLEATDSLPTPAPAGTPPPPGPPRRPPTGPARDRTRLHPVTAVALAQARINTEQALAIIGGVEALPDDLDPDLVTRAEEHLIELAEHYDAKALTGFARTILEVVAPDLADAHLAHQLERLERDAEDANRLRIRDTPQGRVRALDLDGFSGACLKKALFALAAPKHRASQGPLGERTPTTERLGHAFAEYVRRYPADKHPDAGGLNATVVVLLPYDTLIGGIKAAHLDTGERLSPNLAAGSPARPASSPPSSAAPPRSSTSAGHAASTPAASASRPPSSKAAASPRAATHHPPSPTCTTPWSGPAAEGPTATPGCSAHPTTAAPTTPDTPTNASPPARSASTGGSRRATASPTHNAPRCQRGRYNGTVRVRIAEGS